ncbi:MAG: SEC-C metal-binding domain-containing protein, partial [Spirochaetota bacterium]|nr:SEC-C metal-binding domain-containing protein [Spirochaetota bacterium]
TSMKEKWSDEDFADMDGFTQKLERFTLVMWRTMVSIKNASKREMLERLKNKAIIEKIEEQLGAPIRRNDSCPCGSGKKYKYCCGS